MVPADLLTVVYRALEQHVRLSSPRSVTAVVAYLLTAASRPYLAHLCQSMIRGESGHLPSTHERLHFLDAPALFEGDGDGHEETWKDNDHLDMDRFPEFIPSDLADILPIARKSLKLLEAAQPNHWIFYEATAPQEVSWLWTEAEIQRAWSNVQPLHSTPTLPHTDCSPFRVLDTRNSVLDEFKIFDLAPGMLSAGEIDGDSQSAIHKFVATFPESLPMIAPNLHLLCDLVFSPLQNHATLLSSALLSVFLDRASFLCLDAHLILLRSHLLLTSHVFKPRLAAALFSDEDELQTPGRAMKVYHPSAPQQKLPIDGHPQTSKAIGLAAPLISRDTWPPGGSDLSFLLRTVIADMQDSFCPRTRLVEESLDGMQQVMDEAVFRLGFAVRDLPAGTGRERWLDPLSECFLISIKHSTHTRVQTLSQCLALHAANVGNLIIP